MPDSVNVLILGQGEIKADEFSHAPTKALLALKDFPMSNRVA